ncbi:MULTISPECIES: response regulator [unclassified Limnohabitans]|uniref:response regulator n=1 Tax=unclassified Limnohabitans TaxID=2626134 RepID=UPI001304CC6B|nr:MULTISPECIES: response regulator transcription factor [unclassified Limnohabitans]
MTSKILIVEDEPSIQELLRVNLSRAGYDIYQAEHVAAALKMLERLEPDLVLVDWNMPGQSGLEFVKTLRSREQNRLPIIMVSARSSEEDKLKAFEAGVDDFVGKPFHARELLARVKSKIRRFNAEAAAHERIEIDGLAVYPAKQVATVQGVRIDLQKDELALLATLMAKPQQVFTRDKLLDILHGPHSDVSDRNIDTVVTRLRRKLDKAGHPPCLETVRSMGYCYNPSAADGADALD